MIKIYESNNSVYDNCLADIDRLKKKFKKSGYNMQDCSALANKYKNAGNGKEEKFEIAEEVNDFLKWAIAFRKDTKEADRLERNKNSMFYHY